MYVFRKKNNLIILLKNLWFMIAYYSGSVGWEATYLFFIIFTSTSFSQVLKPVWACRCWIKDYLFSCCSDRPFTPLWCHCWYDKQYWSYLLNLRTLCGRFSPGVGCESSEHQRCYLWAKLSCYNSKVLTLPLKKEMLLLVFISKGKGGLVLLCQLAGIHEF